MIFDDWTVVLLVNKVNSNINDMKIERAYSFFFFSCNEATDQVS